MGSAKASFPEEAMLAQSEKETRKQSGGEEREGYLGGPWHKSKEA